MGIDRIGGGKGAPSAAPTGAEAKEQPSSPFDVAGTGRTEPAAPVAANAPPGPLDRLRAGEIDARAYVDLKVEEATRHLHGLPPADLEAIRDELRHRLLSDPALADLVQ